MKEATTSGEDLLKEATLFSEDQIEGTTAAAAAAAAEVIERLVFGKDAADTVVPLKQRKIFRACPTHGDDTAADADNEPFVEGSSSSSDLKTSMTASSSNSSTSSARKDEEDGLGEDVEDNILRGRAGATSRTTKSNKNSQVTPPPLAPKSLSRNRNIRTAQGIPGAFHIIPSGSNTTTPANNNTGSPVISPPAATLEATLVVNDPGPTGPASRCPSNVSGGGSHNSDEDDDQNQAEQGTVSHLVVEGKPYRRHRSINHMSRKGVALSLAVMALMVVVIIFLSLGLTVVLFQQQRSNDGGATPSDNKDPPQAQQLSTLERIQKEQVLRCAFPYFPHFWTNRDK
jgi:hypothetical protein